MIESAGRSRLLQLRRELTTARDGRELLDRKREALLRAVNDHAARLQRLRVSSSRALHEGRRLVREAQMALGRSIVDAAVLSQPASASFAAGETSLVGVPLPTLTMAGAEFRPRYGPATAGAVLDRAGTAMTTALPGLLAFAAADAAVRRLRRALSRTVRRLNALDSIVIPELEREIRQVTSALDEEERDEAIRRERWRTQTREGVLQIF